MLRLGSQPVSLRIGAVPVVALAVGATIIWTAGDDPVGATPVTVAATPIAAAVKVPTPIVSSGGSVTVQAPAIAASARVPSPVVSIPVSVTAAPVAMAAAVPAPAVSIGASAVPVTVAAAAVAGGVVVPAPVVSIGSSAVPVTVAAVPISAAAAVPAPLAAIFPTPVSAFGFAEQAGPTAASKVGSYSLTAAAPASAWGSGGAVGTFTGALGAAASLSAWSVTFDVTVGARPNAGDFSSIIHVAVPVDYYFEINDAGIFDVYLGGATAFAAPSALTNGVKYSIAVTKTGTTVVIYIDGVAVLTNTAIGSTNAANFSNTASVIADGFSGVVDNIRLFGAALTAAQVANVAKVPV